MIHGIGTDIIEVKRIEQSIGRYKQRFLDRVFTAKEQTYCQRHKDSSRHFAGRFAAKEAVAKAIGTGLSEGIGWLDIEISNDIKGRPVVRLSPKLVFFTPPIIHVSISHSRDYAVAFATYEIQ